MTRGMPVFVCEAATRTFFAANVSHDKVADVCTRVTCNISFIAPKKRQQYMVFISFFLSESVVSVSLETSETDKSQPPETCCDSIRHRCRRAIYKPNEQASRVFDFYHVSQCDHIFQCPAPKLGRLGMMPYVSGKRGEVHF